MPKTSVRWLALALLAVLASTAGCGEDEPTGPGTPGAGTPPTMSTGSQATPTGIGADVGANLFRNGSFESGRDPWFSLTTQAWGQAFSQSSEAAHDGDQSALLELRAEASDTATVVYGIVQEVTPPPEFPEVISGYYRVEDWVRGAPKQYLQFVAIAFGVQNLQEPHPNHQIRYILAGVPEDPLVIGNAKYIFLSREDPPIGDWVYFEVPVRQDFAEQWQDVPEGYERLRLLFEVRYDDKSAGTEGRADVFYDDLYMGPAQDNPNQP